MMYEGLKIENIEKYFETIGRTVSTNFTYALVEPKTRWFFFWGPLAAFKYKYYIAAFFPDEIILVQLTAMGNFKDEYKVIPQEDIQAMQIKKGFIQYKVVIQTYEEKIKLRCNKFILSMPWQKENTTYLENNNWYVEKLKG